MSSWFVHVARMARLFGIVLVLAGFAPVLLFSLGVLLPAEEAPAVLDLLPAIPSDWLSTAEAWLRAHKIRWSPQAGLVFALPGILVMGLGAAIAKSQAPVLHANRARNEDARRRVPQYRGVTERQEPTLGPDSAPTRMGTDPEEEPRAPAYSRRYRTARRVGQRSVSSELP